MFQRAQSDRYRAIIDMIQTDSPMVANSLIDQVSYRITNTIVLHFTGNFYQIYCIVESFQDYS